MASARRFATSLLAVDYTGALNNQSYANSLGYGFTVGSGRTLTISHLGCFMSNTTTGQTTGTIPPGGTTITVAISSTTALGTLLGTATFTNADPGTYDTTKRVMYRSVTPIVLGPGTYRIWTYGYGSGYQNYNGAIQGFNPAPNTFGGALSWAGAYSGGDNNAPTTGPTPGIAYGGPTFRGKAT